MRLGESIALALGSLKTGKLRSMLTLLGIIIGIASVITIMTLGASLKAQTFGSLDSMGINDLRVQVQNREEADKAESDYMHSQEPITDADALIPERRLDTLKEQFAGTITGIGASGTGGGKADIRLLNQDVSSLEDKNAQGAVVPVNADYLQLSGIEISHGRALQPQDMTEERRVAVISPKLVTALFNDDPERALGAEIEYVSEKGNLAAVVVGVASDPKGGLLMGDMSAAQLYVPYPLHTMFAQEYGDVLLPDAYSEANIRVNPSANKDAVKADLQTYFDQLYAGNERYLAKVSDSKGDLDSLQKVLDSISMAVAAIGGISLLVGGIGVMNVMLITVTERTREIGIRKALGARSKDIKTQFVVEAMIVCLVGGLIGILLGGALGMLGAKLLGKFVFPPLTAVLVSLLFSLAIGLFFGYYPAAKAAKLNPIQALRYE